MQYHSIIKIYMKHDGNKMKYLLILFISLNAREGQNCSRKLPILNIKCLVILTTSGVLSPTATSGLGTPDVVRMALGTNSYYMYLDFKRRLLFNIKYFKKILCRQLINPNKNLIIKSILKKIIMKEV